MHASWGIKKDGSRQYRLVVHKGNINIGSKYNGTIKKDITTKNIKSIEITHILCVHGSF